MANYYVIRIKFHWGFSYVTHYMKHSLLGTRRVILSIIRSEIKQPMANGTNRMCIRRDDNCVNTMCFPRQLPTTAWNFFDGRDTSCPIGKLPFSFLLCGEFLKTYFLSMPQLSKYAPIRQNERFRKVLQSWRSMQYFTAACEEDTN